MKILVQVIKVLSVQVLVKRLQTEKHEVVGIDTKAEAQIFPQQIYQK